MTDNSFLLTGADGYVGRHLSVSLRARGRVVGLSRTGHTGIACDLRDLRAVGALARAFRPTCIVHAAGFKDLAVCERFPDVAYDTNVTTTVNLLRAWPGVPLLYLSTDYVFSGADGGYQESSPVAPRTAYGRSKMCAEATGQLLAGSAFTAVRVSDLYDASATFTRFLSEEFVARRQVDGFVDAYFSPTFIDDFAAAIIALIDVPVRPSIVHIAGPRTSRYEFARQYARAFGFDERLIRPVRLRTDDRFVYPDLSLATPLAATTLGFVPTDHAVALRLMAQGAVHDHARAVPPVLRFPPNARNSRQRSVGGDRFRRDQGALYAGGALSPRYP